MNDRPALPTPAAPRARPTRRSDALLLLGVVVLAFAIAFGVFYVFIEILKPTAVGDWAIAKSILAISHGFPAGRPPANLWDLGQSLPFAISWSVNKIALGVSLLLYLLLIISSIVPFLALVGVLIYLPWRFYFRARIGGGSIPTPRSGLEHGE
jgi:hypothetical protein